MIVSIYKSKWEEIMPLLHSSESLVSFGNLIQQLPFPTLHLRFVVKRKETLMETHRVWWCNKVAPTDRNSACVSPKKDLVTILIV